MFNIGAGEMLVILLMVLLVFGPDRIPEIARNVGKAIRTFQQETQKAADLLREGIEEAKPPAGVFDTPDPPRPPRDAAEVAVVTDALAASQPPTVPPEVRVLEDT